MYKGTNNVMNRGPHFMVRVQPPVRPERGQRERNTALIPLLFFFPPCNSSAEQISAPMIGHSGQRRPMRLPLTLQLTDLDGQFISKADAVAPRSSTTVPN